MKQILCALALLLTLTLLGCGADRPAETTVNTEGYMDSAEALTIAKEKSSRHEKDLDALYNIVTELNAERGFYTVTFESDTTFYAYEIDAVTGKLLRVKRKGKPQSMAPISITIPTPETTAE